MFYRRRTNENCNAAARGPWSAPRLSNGARELVNYARPLMPSSPSIASRVASRRLDAASRRYYGTPRGLGHLTAASSNEDQSPPHRRAVLRLEDDNQPRVSSGPLESEEGRLSTASAFAFRVKTSASKIARSAVSSQSTSVLAAPTNNSDLPWFNSDGGENPCARLEREMLEIIAHRDLSPPWRIASAGPTATSPASPLRRPVRDKTHHMPPPPPTERENAASADENVANLSRRIQPPSLREAATKAAESDEEVYPYENDEEDGTNKIEHAMERLSRAWHYFENVENEENANATVPQTATNSKHRPLQNPNAKRHLFTSMPVPKLSPASPLRPVTGQSRWNGNLLVPDLAVIVD